jgi:TP901 family phage tail tape measure protein
MAQPAAILSVLVTANTAQATRGLQQFDAQVDRTHKSTNKMSGAMKSMLKGAGLAAVGVAAHRAVSGFVEFDRSMRNVNSIARLNEEQFKKLSREVSKLAGPTAQSPKTLADGLYDLVSSGLDAKDAMTVLRKSAVAATAGLTDTATASKVIVGAMNAYGMSAKDAGHVSDVLFKSVEAGVLTFSDLAQGIGPVLPTARKLGITLEQVGAAASTLTMKGFPAAEAFTAIDAAMRALTKPSEAMKQAFKELGVESGEQLVRKVGSFQAALDAVAKTTDGSSGAMNKLFNEIRGSRGALTLTGENAKTAAGHLRDMGKASGSTERAFREQSKSIGVQWDKAKGRIQDGVNKMGEALVRLIIWVDKVGRSIKQWLINAWGNVKRAFGNAMAAILRGFADLFDVAAKLPVIGGKFKGLADKARGAADRVDQLGENIKDLPSKKEVKLMVSVALEDLAAGNVDKLKFGPLGGPSGGPPPSTGDMMNSIMAGGKAKTREWLVNNMDKIAPLLGSPGTAPGSLGKLERLGHAMGLSTSSGYRPGDPGFHGQNRARDMAGTASQMMRYAKTLYSRFGTSINELIYTPLGVGIDAHRAGPLSSLYPASTLADHYDHVHVAMQKGGLVQRLSSGGEVAHFNKWRGLKGLPAVGWSRDRLDRYMNRHPRQMIDFYDWYKAHIRRQHRGTPANTLWSQRGGGVPGSGSGDKVPAMLEPGEFVMNRKATAKAGPLLAALNKSIPRFASGGLVAKAAHAAGFRGANLLRAVAEAKGESGWNERAVGDGGWSKGLMQIYTKVHGWARGMNLFDPFVNMRAAKRIFDSQGWGAWHADHTPHIGAARAAIAAAFGGRRGGGGGGGSFSRSPFDPGAFSPGTGGPFAWGQETPFGTMPSSPLRNRLARQYDQKVLKKVKPSGWDFSGTWQHMSDQQGMQQALAALTPELTDDIKVAQDAIGWWKTLLGVAQSTGDVGGITQAATSLKQWQDELTRLTEDQNDLLQQQIDAQNAHTQAVNELKDQQKRNEDLIRAQGPSLQAALVQMVNGGIGGNAGLGRSFPSSTGLGGLSRA